MNFEAAKGQLWPVTPFIPDQEPTTIQVVYDYQQLKAYRLQSAPYIVCVNYDLVESMIEEGIIKRQVANYQEWLTWAANSL